MTALLLALVLINPVRLYFQPDQTIPVELDTQAIAQAFAQEGDKAAGPAANVPVLKLVLMNERGFVYAASVLEPDTRVVDLNALFGAEALKGKQVHLWSGKTYFVQLVAGERPIGSALVVVPLFPPNQKDTAAVNALRIYAEKLVKFETTLGSMAYRLDPVVAPTTTLLFSHLVESGFYTNVLFHRVIPGFVIQGGDPTGTGMGGPGFFMDLERSNKPHTKGTISMARQGHDVNTSGSQFFICLSRAGCAPLDGQYTAFGDLVWGMDVVDKIVALPVEAGGANRPKQPPVILKGTLIPAPPRPIGKPPAAQLAVPVQTKEAS